MLSKTLPLCHRCVCLPQKKRYAGFEPATSRSQGTEPSTKLSHCATMAYASHIKNDMLDSNLRPLVHKAQNLPPSSTKTLPLRHRCVCLPHKKRYAGFEPATSHSQGTEPSTKLSHCATMAYASHIKNDMLDSNLRPLVHKAQNLPPSSAKTLPLRHHCVGLPQKIRYAGFEPATSRSQGTEPSTKLSKNFTTTPPLRRPPTKNTVCWIRTCDLSFTRHRTFHQAQQKPYHYATVAYASHIKKQYAGFEPATSRSQGIELSTELSFCATLAYASDRSACVPLRKRINPIIVRYRPI